VTRVDVDPTTRAVVEKVVALETAAVAGGGGGSRLAAGPASTGSSSYAAVAVAVVAVALAAAVLTSDAPSARDGGTIVTSLSSLPAPPAPVVRAGGGGGLRPAGASTRAAVAEKVALETAAVAVALASIRARCRTGDAIEKQPSSPPAAEARRRCSRRFIVFRKPPPTGAAGTPACDGGRCAADAAEAFAAFARLSFSPFLGGIPAARALEIYSAADSAHAARRLRERSTRLGALRSPVGQVLFWARNRCGPPAALCVSGTRFASRYTRRLFLARGLSPSSEI